ncbi:type II secretion system protein J [Candidatus Riflebacteria bacterium]
MWNVKNNKKKLMTLIELMIAMVVFTLFFGAAYKLFTGGQLKAKISTWNGQTIKGLRQAVLATKRDLEKATSASIATNEVICVGSDKTNNDVFKIHYQAGKITGPAPGVWKTIMVFPMSQPYNGGAKVDMVHSVYGLYGERKRSRGDKGKAQNLGSLWVVRFVEKYGSNKTTESAAKNYLSSLKLGTNLHAKKPNPKKLVQNVREVEITNDPVSKTIRLYIKAEMPNMPNVHREQFGEVRVQLKTSTTNSGFRSTAGGRAKTAVSKYY